MKGGGGYILQFPCQNTADSVVVSVSNDDDKNNEKKNTEWVHGSCHFIIAQDMMPKNKQKKTHDSGRTVVLFHHHGMGFLGLRF